MKRILSRRSFQAATGVLAVGASVAVAAASAAPAVAKGKAHAANSAALTVESSPVGEANGFNPFVPTSASTIVGATSLIYEPLFQSNILKPGQYYPFLATKYAWGAGGKSLTFTIRQGVKWSDGSAFSASDVAFTYNLIKNNPSINAGGLAITNVSQSGNTVTLHFATAQYANFQQIAATVYIVQQNQWQNARRSVDLRRHEPDRNRALQGVERRRQRSRADRQHRLLGRSLERRWRRPAVKTVQFPALSSNTSALSALLTDQVDWAGNFIAGVKQAFAGKPLVFWSPPLNTNSLEPEPPPVADQPAGRPSGDQPGDQPQGDRDAG